MVLISLLDYLARLKVNGVQALMGFPGSTVLTDMNSPSEPRYLESSLKFRDLIPATISLLDNDTKAELPSEQMEPSISLMMSLMLLASSNLAKLKTVDALVSLLSMVKVAPLFIQSLLPDPRYCLSHSLKLISEK